MRRARKINGFTDKHEIRGLMERDSWKNLGLANFDVDGSARRDYDQKARPTDRNDTRK